LTFFKDWWRTMGHWRWLNLLPVAIALYLAVGYEAMPADWIDRGERQLGDTHVRLYTRGTVRAGKALPVRVSQSGNSALEIGFVEQPLQRLEPVSGQKGSEQEYETRLQVPATRYDHADLIVRQQGQQARWRIGRLIL
jgi:hypothetical protein